jgi:hypothetical protein
LRLKILNAKVKIIGWPSNSPAKVIARPYGDDSKCAFDEIYLRFDEFVEYPADSPISTTDDNSDYYVASPDGFVEVLYLTGTVLVIEEIHEC